MTHNATLNPVETLSTLLQEKFGIDPALVTDDTVLDTLDLDSLALIELFLLIQKRLGIVIEVGAVDSTDTVGDLAARLSDPSR
jgi:acyl carrier protein